MGLVPAEWDGGKAVAGVVAARPAARARGLANGAGGRVDGALARFAEAQHGEAVAAVVRGSVEPLAGPAVVLKKIKIKEWHPQQQINIDRHARYHPIVK